MDGAYSLTPVDLASPQALSNKTLALAVGTTALAPLAFASGTNLTTPGAGAMEFDGTAFYQTIDTTSGRAQADVFQIFRLTADGSALGTATTDVFGSNSAFPTVLNAIYEFEFHLYFLKTTTGTVIWALTNTQTYTNLVAGLLGTSSGGFSTAGTAISLGIDGSTAAAGTMPASVALSTAVDHYHIIRAIAECGTAGNIRLRVGTGAGTVTPRRGSYYKVRRLFAGNVGTFVA